MKATLIVFAKRPVAGAVKTRLTSLLTPDDAARLYGAFLHDALLQYCELGVRVRLYLAGADDWNRPIPPTATLHRQSGSRLDERMYTAFEESFEEGYERAVVVGTDHPTLPSEYLSCAFEVLDSPESVAIGPSRDGGFYLLGMTRLYEGLFRNMRYSHARVYEETLTRAEKTPACITILPPWHDVDTPDELVKLVRELACERIAAPNTRCAIEDLKTRYDLGKSPGRRDSPLTDHPAQVG